MQSIKLNSIIVNKNEVEYRFSTNELLKKYFESDKRLYIKYNKNIEDIPKSILIIPFLVNVLPILWMKNQEMYIDELDSDFYYCLENVKSGFQSMYPNVKFKGNLRVRNLIKNHYCIEKQSAQLFSGGLDAITTYVGIREEFPILITHYNQYKEGNSENSRWISERKNVTDFATKYKLENIFIESNFGTFLNYKELDKDFSKKINDNWWHGIHHGMAFIGMTAPIMYLMRIGTLYIASSFYKGNPCPCASDPRIDNQIKMASATVYHDGYEYNRQQKIQIITNYVKETKDQIYLKVCFMENKNCCKCEKCMRTILGLIIEGNNPENYGFIIGNNYEVMLKKFLKTELKSFTESKILIWNIMLKRLVENQEVVLSNWDLDWLVEFDLVKERRRSLLEYRIKYFFPIIIRRVKLKLERGQRNEN